MTDPHALPPHSVEAEMVVLGSLIVSGLEDKKLFASMVDRLEPNNFYMPKHVAIFRTIRQEFTRSGGLDVHRLNEAIKAAHTVEECGDVDYLVELAEGVPSPQEGLHYIAIVKRHSRMREVIRIADDVVEACYGANANPDEIAEAAVGDLSVAISRRDDVKHEQAGVVVNRYVEEMRQREPGKFPGLRTGYRSLDAVLMGIEPGDLVVLAARPSMGKSALALNLAESMARTAGPVGFLSLEMSREQLGVRLLSGASGVPMRNIRSNSLSNHDRDDITHAQADIEALPLHIDDTPAITPGRLRSIVRTMVDESGVVCVFVDYLQLMRTNTPSYNETAALTEITGALKAAAGEFGLPIIALSQLNRDNTDGADHAPNLQRLRGSGSIEQDANTVIFLHRPNYYDKTQAESEAWVIVAKNRQGPTATIKTIDWVGSQARFVDQYDIARQPAAPAMLEAV